MQSEIAMMRTPELTNPFSVCYQCLVFVSTGGAVFVDREGQLTVHDSDFENSPEGRHTMQGDIMYSDGGVVVAR